MNEAEKFYEWMKKLGNIYLCDNKGMSKAYQKIIDNSKAKEQTN